MLLLSIDTCGPLGSVALARADADVPVLLAQTELPGKTYSAQLVPAIRELLAAHNVDSAQIEAIVVTSGPGSFTGIRIGLATAKGFAEARQVPIVAVSRLAVLVDKAQAPERKMRAAALDAGRGEFYFRDASATPQEQLLTRDPFLERAAVLGSYLAVCEDAIHAAAPSATLVAPPTAADALHFALQRLRAHDYTDPVTLDGNYLRRSDAEIFSKPKLLPATP